MFLAPDSTLDATARIVVTAALFIWNAFEGAKLDSAYPTSLVQLYALPLFRFVLALSVYVAMMWCPRVGAMMALAVFFYIEDLEKLRKPWTSFSSNK